VEVFCRTVANAAAIALRNAEILELLRARTREIVKVQTEAEDRVSSLKQYEEFFVGAIDGMMALEQSGRIVFANPKACDLLEVNAAEVTGRSFSEYLPDGEQQQFAVLLDEFVRGEAGERADFCLERDQSKEQIISISAGSLFGEKGMMLLTLRDVTDERLTERRLADAQRRLIHTEKRAAMAQLAGATAHELNQPLTSILASLAMLRRLITGDGREHRIIDTMEQESERMAAIIRRMTKITNYTTTPYVGGAKIIDLNSACPEDPTEDDK
jgi:PAS domain S-box-containing protein